MTDMPIKINVKQCTICLDKIHMKSDSCTTLCKHTFHKTCIDAWARPGCPLCRQDTGLHIVDHHLKFCSAIAEQSERWFEQNRIMINICEQYHRYEITELIYIRYTNIYHTALLSILAQEQQICKDRYQVLCAEFGDNEHDPIWAASKPIFKNVDDANKSLTSSISIFNAKHATANLAVAVANLA